MPWCETCGCESDAPCESDEPEEEEEAASAAAADDDDQMRDETSEVTREKSDVDCGCGGCDCECGRGAPESGTDGWADECAIQNAIFILSAIN